MRVLDPNLVIYVVYQRPKDLPQHRFVVRRQWPAEKDGRPAIVFDPQPSYAGDSLEKARAAIPQERVRLEPMVGDDPTIVETWI